jgi:hypothetical protein
VRTTATSLHASQRQHRITAARRLWIEESNGLSLLWFFASLRPGEDVACPASEAGLFDGLPCGSMAMIPCRLAPRRLRGGLGSNLRGPRDMPAVSSRLRRPHRAPIYPHQPLPRPSRFGCGLLGSSSFCPKMNGAVLSPELSFWFAPNLTTGRGIRASARWQMYVCQAAISKPCSRGPEGTGPPSQTTEKPGPSGRGRFSGIRLDDGLGSSSAPGGLTALSRIPGSGGPTNHYGGDIPKDIAAHVREQETIQYPVI